MLNVQGSELNRGNILWYVCFFRGCAKRDAPAAICNRFAVKNDRPAVIGN